MIKQFECHHNYVLVFPFDISETIERLVGMILKWKNVITNFKWENLKVFAITKVTHARIYVCAKKITTMSHRNENFYKFLEDVRENANMLKPYYDEENSFEKKSVSITRAYWRKKPREWKWLRVTAAYCKKLTVNFIWDNFYLFFKWRANNFYRGTF